MCHSKRSIKPKIPVSAPANFASNGAMKAGALRDKLLSRITQKDQQNPRSPSTKPRLPNIPCRCCHYTHVSLHSTTLTTPTWLTFMYTATWKSRVLMCFFITTTAIWDCGLQQLTCIRPSSKTPLDPHTTMSWLPPTPFHKTTIQSGRVLLTSWYLHRAPVIAVLRLPVIAPGV